MQNYFLIPEDAFKDLSKLELAIYGIVDRFDRANKDFTGSDAWLVKRLSYMGFNTREQSVNRAIRKLKDLGYIVSIKSSKVRQLRKDKEES